MIDEENMKQEEEDHPITPRSAGLAGWAGDKYDWINTLHHTGLSYFPIDLAVKHRPHNAFTGTGAFPREES